MAEPRLSAASSATRRRCGCWRRACGPGEVSHAYLFYGPPGWASGRWRGASGRRSSRGATRRPRTGRCGGLHPDLTEVQPEGAFTTIGQVREIVRLAASRPFEGARRVFILQADTLNVQAANALLKTLEEPEGEAVFVLLATSREGVLPTILSRAQAVRFNPVPADEVAGFLEERGAAEPELAAALGRGSVGLSLRYAEDPEFEELREAVFGAGFAFSEDFEGRHGAVGGIVGRAEAVGAARESEVLDAVEEPDRRAKDGAKRAGQGGAGRGGAGGPGAAGPAVQGRGGRCGRGRGARGQRGQGGGDQGAGGRASRGRLGRGGAGSGGSAGGTCV